MNQLIYCGPAVPRGGLNAFAVFIGRLPENVQKLIDQCPEIGALIVPIEDLGSVRRRCEVAGTEEHRLYKAVLGHAWEAKE